MMYIMEFQDKGIQDKGLGTQHTIIKVMPANLELVVLPHIVSTMLEVNRITLAGCIEQHILSLEDMKQGMPQL